MKKAILFISDIHYCNGEEESQFTKDDTKGYCRKWKNYLKSLQQEENISFKYLVITGDITESAQKVEYKVMAEVLNGLCDELQIQKKDVLIIPGNHDINRAKLEVYCDDHGYDKEKSSELFGVKLDNFIEFYKEFLEVESLDVDKAVLNSIYIEEIDTYFVGLNSLVKIGHDDKDNIGKIDVNKLDAEMTEFLKHNGQNVFVVAHHSFADTGERELASIENARLVKETLRLKGINTFIYGHHHTSESKLGVMGDCEECHRYIEIGSLGKILQNINGDSYTNRFSIAICEEDELILRDFSYTAADWVGLDNKKYMRKLKINANSKEENIVISKLGELPNAPEDERVKKPLIHMDEVMVFEKNRFLIEYLKKENNYKEGHFHWNDGRKTLGWINIAAFLGDINILSGVKDCIIEMHKNYFRDVEAVIGYGMEGNIIGSLLMSYWVENEISYCFFPSVHKKEEHIMREKKLWNKCNDYKNILLICDIMPNLDYLKEIIESVDQLQKCSKLYIVSLFHNKNLLRNDVNVGGISAIDIRRYTLTEINIPICELDEAKCIICKEKLKKVYNL